MDSVGGIYISCARQDYDAAKHIYSLLKELGIEVFWDMESIGMGMDYATECYQSIQKNDIFIFLLSNNYINSAWCRKELEMASGLTKTLILITIDGTPPSKIPVVCKKYKIFDFESLSKNSENLKKAFNEIDKIEYAGTAIPDSNGSETKRLYAPMKSHQWGGVSKKRRNRLAFIVFFILIIFGVIVISPIPYKAYYKTFNNRKQCALPRSSRKLSKTEKKQYFPQFYHGKSIGPTETDTLFIKLSEKDGQISGLLLENSYLEDEMSKMKARINRLQILLFFTFILIIFCVVLFFRGRRKSKRIHSNLNITSDARTEALVDGNRLFIDKRESKIILLPIGAHNMELNYTSFNKPKVINCFIGGSTKLQSERDALRATISVVHNTWKEKNFQIFSFTFEDFDKKFVSLSGGQQSLYDTFIENDANIAIFIIKGDVGEITNKEFKKAYSSFIKNGHPSIVVYHEMSSVLDSTGKALKEYVEETGQYWNDYKTTAELKYHFQEILSADLWGLYESELTTLLRQQGTM